MRSGYKIEWSDEAKDNLSNIIKYLEKAWTEKEIKKFFVKLESNLLLMSENPSLFPLSNKTKNVRRNVLSPQTSLYFKVEKDVIFIVSLFDNRQNPKKLKI
jgi:plasmid stabilization system protein ParE